MYSMERKEYPYRRKIVQECDRFASAYEIGNIHMREFLDKWQEIKTCDVVAMLYAKVWNILDLHILYNGSYLGNG